MVDLSWHFGPEFCRLSQIVSYNYIFRFEDSEKQINYESFFCALNWRANPMPELEAVSYLKEVKLMPFLKNSHGYLPRIFNILYLEISFQYKILRSVLLERAQCISGYLC